MSTIVVMPPAAAAAVADAKPSHVGPAGLVHVHVRVDEPRQQHGVVRQRHGLRGSQLALPGSDLRDQPVPDADPARRDPAPGHHPAGRNDEIVPGHQEPTSGPDGSRPRGSRRSDSGSTLASSHRRPSGPVACPGVGRTLAEFNGLAAEAAERELATCNAAPRFVREVAAGRPYPTAATLAETAATVAGGLGWDEVAVALAAHPRIGERAARATRPRRRPPGASSPR